MNDTFRSVPILSIGEINSSSGKNTLGNEFHVTRSSELSGIPKYEKPVKGDHFVFLLALEGKTNMTYSLLDYEIVKNDLFILSPGVIHQFHTEKDGELIGAGFTKDFFSGSLIHKKHSEVFNILFTDNDPHFKLSAAEAETLHQLMLMLRNCHSDKEHAFQDDVMFHAFNLFMLEAAAIFKKHRCDAVSRFTRKEELLMCFLKLLSEHFYTQRSVQFYADKIFVTPKHLSRAIKEVTGKTVGQLIDEMVIAEARILLDAPSLTIGDVADRLNFSNQFFFSKFFKNHTGISPSHFKMNGAC
ncbi:helix-turn-helix domain-containing protein [Mucilaginibacter terrae]|uniref:AraC family transcriptional activator of pobA n=1 Tax=Mucilaginibacter terrae TaxID=1955052 RepID=A0ABU3GNG6_9SPHI|nr:helix-turn-helix domain-containing protein [Mucilaginibacter terrae]MDT3401328.1 AraC family transcriptional activator of pobA [Mucilaginibacter terrae]